MFSPFLECPEDPGPSLRCPHQARLLGGALTPAGEQGRACAQSRAQSQIKLGRGRKCGGPEPGGMVGRGLGTCPTRGRPRGLLLLAPDSVPLLTPRLGLRSSPVRWGRAAPDPGSVRVLLGQASLPRPRSPDPGCGPQDRPCRRCAENARGAEPGPASVSPAVYARLLCAKEAASRWG